jgi:ankyrin repeat protein
VGKTALFYVIENYNYDFRVYSKQKQIDAFNIVQLLVKNGANVNDNLGFYDGHSTLLMLAYNCFNITSFLLENGALNTINVQNDYGWTALYRNVRNSSSYEVAQLLLENGANYPFKTKSGKTCLDKLKKNRNSEIITGIFENEILFRNIFFLYSLCMLV